MLSDEHNFCKHAMPLQSTCHVSISMIIQFLEQACLSVDSLNFSFILLYMGAKMGAQGNEGNPKRPLDLTTIPISFLACES